MRKRICQWIFAASFFALLFSPDFVIAQANSQPKPKAAAKKPPLTATEITEARELLDKLLFRFKSVLAARNNKYLLMNAPNEALEAIINILPGMKSPTVVPLAAEGWSSVHTVISEDRFWEIIDQLKAVGAQGILIIPIQKMIL